MKETRLIRIIIATIVLLWTIGIIVRLDEESIALIATLSGIAGSAATFLFSTASTRE